jgi:hypothetical protein
MDKIKALKKCRHAARNVARHVFIPEGCLDKAGYHFAEFGFT